MWGQKPDMESRRRSREEFFELMLEFQEDLMADFVFDEDRQLFKTPDGRPVLSRYTSPTLICSSAKRTGCQAGSIKVPAS